MYVSSSYVQSFISPQNVVAKKNTKNRTKQNENEYNSWLSLQLVLYIFTAHYTVDYCKHEIHLRTSLLVWNKITLGRSKPKWSWQHLTTSILLALNNFINRRITKITLEWQLYASLALRLSIVLSFLFSLLAYIVKTGSVEMIANWCFGYEPSMKNRRHCTDLCNWARLRSHNTVLYFPICIWARVCPAQKVSLSVVDLHPI